MQELVVWNSVQSPASVTDIEGNISEPTSKARNSLDEQFGSGCRSGIFGTRQLRRDQTECMVIRRASDSTTTTIGFDSVQATSTEAAIIETFCTGTTCTVETWKDQSGNGNDDVLKRLLRIRTDDLHGWGDCVKDEWTVSGGWTLMGSDDVFAAIHGRRYQTYQQLSII